MWGGFESRKFPRVKADCRIYIEQFQNAETLTSTTENIGIGGICVVLKKPLPKFSRLRIQLDLADGEKTISCDGRVVWMVESRNLVTEQATHDAGIEFLNLAEDARLRIEKIIKSKITA